jgi:hypothetical protein
VASPARNGELCRDLSFLSERGIQIITLDGTAAPAPIDAAGISSAALTH